MTGADRRCDACGDRLAPATVYHRFALALEAELDVLDDGSPDASDVAAKLASLERAHLTAEDAEAEVHWEASGLICGACRRELLRCLGRARAVH